MRVVRCALWGIGLSIALTIVFVGLVAVGLRAPRPRPSPERGVELSRVHLVEPGGERSGPVRVRVVEGRIAEIGPAGSGEPDDPLQDAYLLPGLTDMHIHFPITGFPGDDAYTALLLLRHGITTARLTGGVAPEDTREWNDRITAGEAPGPRFFSCGPIVDGPDPLVPGNRSIRGATEAREVVSELAERGVHCIKAYDRLDFETTTALRQAAQAAGLPLIGHTPQALAFGEPVLDDVQHLRGVHPPFEGESLVYPQFLRAWHRLDDAWLAHVVETSLREGIAHTPTLVSTEAIVVSHDWARWRESTAMQLYPPHLADGIFSGEVGFNPGRFASEADIAMVNEARHQMARTVHALHAAGVPIHTGSDANVPNLVPGPSLHRELALLVEAGLSPEEAIAASTRTSTRSLGLEFPGEIRVGAPADFVLYAEDPTQDIGALDSMLAVVRDGRLYSRQDLDERIGRYADHYSSPLYAGFVMPTLRWVLAEVTDALTARTATDERPGE